MLVLACACQLDHSVGLHLASNNKNEGKRVIDHFRMGAPITDVQKCLLVGAAIVLSLRAEKTAQQAENNRLTSGM